MHFLKPKGALHEKGPALLLVAYLVFSAIWIIGTDLLLEFLQLNGPLWHSLKGLAYLGVSGAILYTMARRFLGNARRLETTLEQLIEQTDFGVWFVDTNGCILECNQATADFFGYTPKELRGKGYLDLVHPDERLQAERGWQGVKESKETVVRSLCRKFVRKDGKYVWGRLTASKITSNTPAGHFLVGLLHDVTNEVEAFEALRQRETELEASIASVRESEAKFHRFVDSALIGIAVGSSRGRFVEANSVFLRLLGYSREDLLNGMLTWDSITPPEYRAQILSGVAEVRETGRISPHETEFLAKDGRRIPVLVGGGFLSGDRNGEHIAALSVMDIRDARRTEAQLSRLVLAVESAYEAIVISELDGSISYVNPAFEKLTGYSRVEVLGKNPRFLKSGKTPAEAYRELWQKLGKGGAWRGQFHNRRKDGSEYVEEATISPVRDTSGRTVNYLAMKWDVTRERELEQQLFQSQKLQTVGQLASGIAHDLNNVLQVVHSSSELALRNRATGDYAKKKLNDILSVSRRGAAIIGQLLTFSRQKADHLQLIQLNEVIADTGRMLRRLLRENIAVEFRLAAELPLIEADLVKTSQVLFNLTVNARDAMANGGVITVTTSVIEDSPEKKGPFVLLSVKDTGSGIAEDVRPRIFDAFFTTKEPGKGTGLGLSTVYRIVRQSRGSIYVSSEVGQGTTFEIYYPVANAEAGGEKAAAEQEQAAAIVPKVGTVLVCEDDEAVRAGLSEYLQLMGYHVIACDNSVEALLVAEQQRPEVLITDIIMPGEDGIRLARQLRKNNPELKIILMSGHTDEEILQRVAECTDMAFLEKPFTAASMMESLNRLKTEEVDAGAEN